jgi:hypothetical protein
LQIANDRENVATKNKTKARLYNELVEEFLIEMGELLEHVEVEFK